MLRITLAGVPEPFISRPGKSVLEALSSVHASQIQSGCHNGGCGVCRIRILEGSYQTKSVSRFHVDDADAAEGIGLACRTFPASDLVIEVLGRIPAELAIERNRRRKSQIRSAQKKETSSCQS